MQAPFFKISNLFNAYFEWENTYLESVHKNIYMILLFTTGIGILPYIILAIIMDEAPESEKTTRNNKTAYSYSANDYYEFSEPVGFKPSTDDSEIRGFSIW